MLFRYVVYAPQTGKTSRGALDAPSEQAAEQMLWQDDHIIIVLEEVTAAAAAARKLSPAALFPSVFGVKAGDVTTFSRHLAALLASGVGLLPALQVLSEQARGQFQTVLEQVIMDVQRGESLSGAVHRQGRAFPSFYERMLRVGERSGNLEVVLQQIAVYMEKEQAVSRRVQRALAYPAFVFLVGLLVIFVILTFAMPALNALYTEFQAELPLPTRLLLGVTGFLQAYRLPLLVVLLALGVAAYVALRTESGQLARDRLLLGLPLFGAISMRGILARYTRTLSLLLRAGLPLVEIMDLVEATVGNRLARRVFAAVRRDVIRGQALSAALGAQSLLPPMLAQVVRVGEETGKLEANLEALADLYEDETDRAIGAMTGILEPGLTILVGLLVAFVALATILPIYNLLQHMR